MFDMIATDRDNEMRTLGWGLHAAGLLVLLAGCAAAHYIAFRPLAAREQASLDRYTDLADQLRNIEDVRREQTTLNESLARIERRAQDVRESIPDHPQKIEFLKQLESDARRENVEVRDYQVGMDVEQAGHFEFPVDLSLEGDYRSVCGFLQRLAEMQRISTVDELELITDGSKPTYPVEIRLVLYFKMDNSKPPTRSVRHDAS